MLDLLTAMNLLTAHYLSLAIGNKTLVAEANLEIRTSEFIGLIGPNGAGKSSLMRMLAGLVRPTTGSLSATVDNKPGTLADMHPGKRARFMAYLAQHETPAWPLTAKNLVALGRTPWNSSFNIQAEDELAIKQAMQMTEVEALQTRPITELSGGELQRVLLARVFAGKPQLIIADEPIAALDIYHQLHIMELLQAHSKQGGAVIAALHDLGLAARFCSRLILLHQGRVIAEGEPIKVLTSENLKKVYGVEVHVDCRDDGVVIIPTKRIQSC